MSVFKKNDVLIMTSIHRAGGEVNIMLRMSIDSALFWESIFCFLLIIMKIENSEEVEV